MPSILVKAFFEPLRGLISANISAEYFALVFEISDGRLVPLYLNEITAPREGGVKSRRLDSYSSLMPA